MATGCSITYKSREYTPEEFKALLSTSADPRVMFALKQQELKKIYEDQLLLTERIADRTDKTNAVLAAEKIRTDAIAKYKALHDSMVAAVKPVMTAAEERVAEAQAKELLKVSVDDVITTPDRTVTPAQTTAKDGIDQLKEEIKVIRKDMDNELEQADQLIAAKDRDLQEMMETPVIELEEKPIVPVLEAAPVVMTAEPSTYDKLVTAHNEWKDKIDALQKQKETLTEEEIQGYVKKSGYKPVTFALIEATEDPALKALYTENMGMFYKIVRGGKPTFKPSMQIAHQAIDNKIKKLKEPSKPTPELKVYWDKVDADKAGAPKEVTDTVIPSRSLTIPEDIHKLAADVGVDIEDVSFFNASVRLTGQEHLDNMSGEQLDIMAGYISSGEAQRDAGVFTDMGWYDLPQVTVSDVFIPAGPTIQVVAPVVTTGEVSAAPVTVTPTEDNRQATVETETGEKVTVTDPKNDQPEITEEENKENEKAEEVLGETAAQQMDQVDKIVEESDPSEVVFKNGLPVEGDVVENPDKVTKETAKDTVEAGADAAIGAVVDNGVTEKEAEEIAKEENIAIEEVKPTIRQAVMNALRRVKPSFKYGKKLRSVVLRVLKWLTGVGAVYLLLNYTGVTKSMSTPGITVTDTVATAKPPVRFAAVTYGYNAEVYWCQEFVNNQIAQATDQRVIAYLGLNDDAWRGTGKMVDKGMGEFVYNAIPAHRPNLLTPEAIDNYLKRTISNNPIPADLKLQAGDIIHFFFEGSDFTKQAWMYGTHVPTTHVGIIKVNAKGELVVEHNIHGIILQNSFQQVFGGEVRSLTGGNVFVSAIARPNYEKAMNMVQGEKGSKVPVMQRAPIPSPVIPTQSSAGTLLGLSMLLSKLRGMLRRKKSGETPTEKELEEMQEQAESMSVGRAAIAKEFEDKIREKENQIKILQDIADGKTKVTEATAKNLVEMTREGLPELSKDYESYREGVHDEFKRVMVSVMRDAKKGTISDEMKEQLLTMLQGMYQKALGIGISKILLRQSSDPASIQFREKKIQSITDTINVLTEQRDIASGYPEGKEAAAEYQVSIDALKKELEHHKRALSATDIRAQLSGQQHEYNTAQTNYIALYNTGSTDATRSVPIVSDLMGETFTIMPIRIVSETTTPVTPAAPVPVLDIDKELAKKIADLEAHYGKLIKDLHAKKPIRLVEDQKDYDRIAAIVGADVLKAAMDNTHRVINQKTPDTEADIEKIEWAYGKYLYGILERIRTAPDSPQKTEFYEQMRSKKQALVKLFEKNETLHTGSDIKLALIQTTGDLYQKLRDTALQSYSLIMEYLFNMETKAGNIAKQFRTFGDPYQFLEDLLKAKADGVLKDGYPDKNVELKTTVDNAIEFAQALLTSLTADSTLKLLDSEVSLTDMYAVLKSEITTLNAQTKPVPSNRQLISTMELIAAQYSAETSAKQPFENTTFLNGRVGSGKTSVVLSVALKGLMGINGSNIKDGVLLVGDNKRVGLNLENGLEVDQTGGKGRDIDEVIEMLTKDALPAGIEYIVIDEAVRIASKIRDDKVIVTNDKGDVQYGPDGKLLKKIVDGVPTLLAAYNTRNNKKIRLILAGDTRQVVEDTSDLANVLLSSPKMNMVTTLSTSFRSKISAINAMQARFENAGSHNTKEDIIKTAASVADPWNTVVAGPIYGVGGSPMTSSPSTKEENLINTLRNRMGVKDAKGNILRKMLIVNKGKESEWREKIKDFDPAGEIEILSYIDAQGQTPNEVYMNFDIDLGDEQLNDMGKYNTALYTSSRGTNYIYIATHEMETIVDASLPSFVKSVDKNLTKENQIREVAVKSTYEHLDTITKSKVVIPEKGKEATTEEVEKAKDEAEKKDDAEEALIEGEEAIHNPDAPDLKKESTPTADEVIEDEVKAQEIIEKNPPIEETSETKAKASFQDDGTMLGVGEDGKPVVLMYLSSPEGDSLHKYNAMSVLDSSGKVVSDTVKVKRPDGTEVEEERNVFSVPKVGEQVIIVPEPSGVDLFRYGVYRVANEEYYQRLGVLSNKDVAAFRGFNKDFEDYDRNLRAMTPNKIKDVLYDFKSMKLDEIMDKFPHKNQIIETVYKLPDRSIIHVPEFMRPKISELKEMTVKYQKKDEKGKPIDSRPIHVPYDPATSDGSYKKAYAAVLQQVYNAMFINPNGKKVANDPGEALFLKTATVELEIMDGYMLHGYTDTGYEAGTKVPIMSHDKTKRFFIHNRPLKAGGKYLKISYLKTKPIFIEMEGAMLSSADEKTLHRAMYITPMQDFIRKARELSDKLTDFITSPDGMNWKLDDFKKFWQECTLYEKTFDNGHKARFFRDDPKAFDTSSYLFNEIAIQLLNFDFNKTEYLKNRFKTDKGKELPKWLEDNELDRMKDMAVFIDELLKTMQKKEKDGDFSDIARELRGLQQFYKTAEDPKTKKPKVAKFSKNVEKPYLSLTNLKASDATDPSYRKAQVAWMNIAQANPEIKFEGQKRKRIISNFQKRPSRTGRAKKDRVRVGKTLLKRQYVRFGGKPSDGEVRKDILLYWYAFQYFERTKTRAVHMEPYQFKEHFDFLMKKDKMMSPDKSELKLKGKYKDFTEMHDAAGTGNVTAQEDLQASVEYILSSYDFAELSLGEMDQLFSDAAFDPATKRSSRGLRINVPIHLNDRAKTGKDTRTVRKKTEEEKLLMADRKAIHRPFENLNDHQIADQMLESYYTETSGTTIQLQFQKNVDTAKKEEPKGPIVPEYTEPSAKKRSKAEVQKDIDILTKEKAERLAEIDEELSHMVDEESLQQAKDAINDEYDPVLAELEEELKTAPETVVLPTGTVSNVIDKNKVKKEKAKADATTLLTEDELKDQSKLWSAPVPDGMTDEKAINEHKVATTESFVELALLYRELKGFTGAYADSIKAKFKAKTKTSYAEGMDLDKALADAIHDTALDMNRLPGQEDKDGTNNEEGTELEREFPDDEDAPFEEDTTVADEVDDEFDIEEDVDEGDEDGGDIPLPGYTPPDGGAKYSKEITDEDLQNTLSGKARMRYLRRFVPGANKLIIKFLDRAAALKLHGENIWGKVKDGAVMFTEVPGGDSVPMRVIKHEAFHAIFRYFTSEKLRYRIYDVAKRFYNLDGHNPDEIEEYLANEFDSRKDRGIIPTLIAKFFNFWRRVFGIITRDQAFIEDYFLKIESGYFNVPSDKPLIGAALKVNLTPYENSHELYHQARIMVSKDYYDIKQTGNRQTIAVKASLDRDTAVARRIPYTESEIMRKLHDRFMKERDNLLAKPDRSSNDEVKLKLVTALSDKKTFLEMMREVLPLYRIKEKKDKTSKAIKMELTQNVKDMKQNNTALTAEDIAEWEGVEDEGVGQNLGTYIDVFSDTDPADSLSENVKGILKMLIMPDGKIIDESAAYAILFHKIHTLPFFIRSSSSQTLVEDNVTAIMSRVKEYLKENLNFRTFDLGDSNTHPAGAIAPNVDRKIEDALKKIQSVWRRYGKKDAPDINELRKNPEDYDEFVNALQDVVIYYSNVATNERNPIMKKLYYNTYQHLNNLWLIVERGDYKLKNDGTRWKDNAGRDIYIRGKWMKKDYLIEIHRVLQGTMPELTDTNLRKSNNLASYTIYQMFKALVNEAYQPGYVKFGELANILNDPTEGGKLLSADEVMKRVFKSFDNNVYFEKEGVLVYKGATIINKNIHKVSNKKWFTEDVEKIVNQFYGAGSMDVDDFIAYHNRSKAIHDFGDMMALVASASPVAPFKFVIKAGDYHNNYMAKVYNQPITTKQEIDAAHRMITAKMRFGMFSNFDPDKDTGGVPGETSLLRPNFMLDLRKKSESGKYTDLGYNFEQAKAYIIQFYRELNIDTDDFIFNDHNVKHVADSIWNLMFRVNEMYKQAQTSKVVATAFSDDMKNYVNTIAKLTVAHDTNIYTSTYLSGEGNQHNGLVKQSTFSSLIRIAMTPGLKNGDPATIQAEDRYPHMTNPGKYTADIGHDRTKAHEFVVTDKKTGKKKTVILPYHLLNPLNPFGEGNEIAGVVSSNLYDSTVTKDFKGDETAVPYRKESKAQTLSRLFVSNFMMAFQQLNLYGTAKGTSIHQPLHILSDNNQTEGAEIRAIPEHQFDRMYAQILLQAISRPLEDYEDKEGNRPFDIKDRNSFASPFTGSKGAKQMNIELQKTFQKTKQEKKQAIIDKVPEAKRADLEKAIKGDTQALARMIPEVKHLIQQLVSMKQPVIPNNIFSDKEIEILRNSYMDTYQKMMNEKKYRLDLVMLDFQEKPLVKAMVKRIREAAYYEAEILLQEMKDITAGATKYKKNSEGVITGQYTGNGMSLPDIHKLISIYEKVMSGALGSSMSAERVTELSHGKVSIQRNEKGENVIAIDPTYYSTNKFNYHIDFDVLRPLAHLYTNNFMINSVNLNELIGLSTMMFNKPAKMVKRAAIPAAKGEATNNNGGAYPDPLNRFRIGAMEDQIVHINLNIPHEGHDLVWEAKQHHEIPEKLTVDVAKKIIDTLEGYPQLSKQQKRNLDTAYKFILNTPLKDEYVKKLRDASRDRIVRTEVEVNNAAGLMSQRGQSALQIVSGPGSKMKEITKPIIDGYDLYGVSHEVKLAIETITDRQAGLFPNMLKTRIDMDFGSLRGETKGLKTWWQPGQILIPVPERLENVIYRVLGVTSAVAVTTGKTVYTYSRPGYADKSFNSIAELDKYTLAEDGVSISDRARYVYKLMLEGKRNIMKSDMVKQAKELDHAKYLKSFPKAEERRKARAKKEGKDYVAKKAMTKDEFLNYYASTYTGLSPVRGVYTIPVSYITLATIPKDLYEEAKMLETYRINQLVANDFKLKGIDASPERMNRLEELYNWDDREAGGKQNQPIYLIAPPSAIKTGVPNTQMKWDPLTQSWGDIDHKKSTFTVHLNDFSVQQKPTDSAKNQTTALPTQLHAMVNINDQNKGEVKVLQTTMATIMKLQGEILDEIGDMKEIQKNKFDTEQWFKNMEEAAKIYKHKAGDNESKEASADLLEEQPSMVNEPTFNNDIQMTIGSAVNNALHRHRFDGMKLTQVSPASREMIGTQKLPEWDEASKTAEIYVTDIFAEKVRTAFFNKTGEILTNAQIMERIPVMLGYRIPSTGLNSAARLKVIGFYPSRDNVNAVIGPTEMTFIMGSDFDADALFVMMAQFPKIKNGKLSMGKETLKIYNEIYANYSKPGNDLRGMPVGFDIVKNTESGVYEIAPVEGFIENLKALYEKAKARDSGRTADEVALIRDFYIIALRNQYLNTYSELMRKQTNQHDARYPINFRAVKEIQLEDSDFNLRAFALDPEVVDGVKRPDSFESKWKAAFESGDLFIDEDVQDLLRDLRDSLLYEDILLNSPVGHADTKMEATGGSNMTGMFANSMTLEGHIKMASKDLSDAPVEEQKIEIDESASFNYNGQEYDEIVFTTEDKKPIFYRYQLMVNAVIDNIKEQIAAILNINEATINSYNGLRRTKLTDKSIGTILNQPVIRSFTRNFSKFNSKDIFTMVKQLYIFKTVKEMRNSDHIVESLQDFQAVRILRDAGEAKADGEIQQVQQLERLVDKMSAKERMDLVKQIASVQFDLMSEDKKRAWVDLNSVVMEDAKRNELNVRLHGEMPEEDLADMRSGFGEDWPYTEMNDTESRKWEYYRNLDQAEQTLSGKDLNSFIAYQLSTVKLFEKANKIGKALFTMQNVISIVKDISVQPYEQQEWLMNTFAKMYKVKKTQYVDEKTGIVYPLSMGTIERDENNRPILNEDFLIKGVDFYNIPTFQEALEQYEKFTRKMESTVVTRTPFFEIMATIVSRDLGISARAWEYEKTKHFMKSTINNLFSSSVKFIADNGKIVDMSTKNTKPYKAKYMNKTLSGASAFITELYDVLLVMFKSGQYKTNIFLSNIKFQDADHYGLSSFNYKKQGHLTPSEKEYYAYHFEALPFPLQVKLFKYAMQKWHMAFGSTKYSEYVSKSLRKAHNKEYIKMMDTFMHEVGLEILDATIKAEAPVDEDTLVPLKSKTDLTTKQIERAQARYAKMSTEQKEAFDKKVAERAAKAAEKEATRLAKFKARTEKKKAKAAAKLAEAIAEEEMERVHQFRSAFLRERTDYISFKVAGIDIDKVAMLTGRKLEEFRDESKDEWEAKQAAEKKEVVSTGDDPDPDPDNATQSTPAVEYEDIVEVDMPIKDDYSAILTTTQYAYDTTDNVYYHFYATYTGTDSTDWNRVFPLLVQKSAGKDRGNNILCVRVKVVTDKDTGKSKAYYRRLTYSVNARNIYLDEGAMKYGYSVKEMFNPAAPMLYTDAVDYTDKKTGVTMKIINVPEDFNTVTKRIHLTDKYDYAAERVEVWNVVKELVPANTKELERVNKEIKELSEAEGTRNTEEYFRRYEELAAEREKYYGKYQVEAAADGFKGVENVKNAYGYAKHEAFKDSKLFNDLQETAEMREVINNVGITNTRLFSIARIRALAQAWKDDRLNRCLHN